jgi:hypothetical protein
MSAGNSYTPGDAAVLIQIKFFEAPVAHDATHDGAVLLLHHACSFLRACHMGGLPWLGHLTASSA